MADNFIGFGHEEGEDDKFIGFGGEDPDYKAEVKKVKKLKRLKKKEEAKETAKKVAEVAVPELGILDKLKGGFGKAKSAYGTAKGYYGGAKNTVTKGKSWIVAIILAIIGSSVGALVLGAIGLLIGLGIVILYLLFKKWPKFTTFIIILIVVIYVVWMFAYGGGGFYSAQAGTYGTELKEMFKPVASQLGLTKMMLSGEYNPSEIWTSKVYKDRYAQESGVEVSDVKPLRDYFSTKDKAVIIGTLKVLALPESPDRTQKGVTVDISAYDSETKDWNCDPDRLARQQRFYGRFQCVSEKTFSVAAGKEMESKEVDVSIKLREFETIAGKSTYVVDYNTLNLLYLEEQDPMTYYQLTKSQIASWQSNSPVNLGLGILGEKDIIAANDADNKVAYYLGVTVRNTGTGNINEIKDIIIEVPETIDVLSGGDNDFELLKCETLGGNFNLCKYHLEGRINLCDTLLDTECKLTPAEYRTVYLKFKVQKSTFLGSANIKEFFALADVTFNYEDVTKVPIQVKELQQFIKNK